MWRVLSGQDGGPKAPGCLPPIAGRSPRSCEIQRNLPAISDSMRG
jgi:hypothetical protein